MQFFNSNHYQLAFSLYLSNRAFLCYLSPLSLLWREAVLRGPGFTAFSFTQCQATSFIWQTRRSISSWLKFHHEDYCWDGSGSSPANGSAPPSYLSLGETWVYNPWDCDGLHYFYFFLHGGSEWAQRGIKCLSVYHMASFSWHYQAALSNDQIDEWFWHGEHCQRKDLLNYESKHVPNYMQICIFHGG